MKILKYICIIAMASLIFACSEDAMDEVNKDLNNTTVMDAKTCYPTPS